VNLNNPTVLFSDSFNSGTNPNPLKWISVIPTWSITYLNPYLQFYWWWSITDRSWIFRIK
jgi:hypothetical protein